MSKGGEGEVARRPDQCSLFPSLHFLIRAMLSLDCLNTPGIFRVQGDAGMVYELQRRIDQGRYTLAGLVDTSRDKEGPTALVAVLASALKLWMRELKEPIFPEDMYNACLKASDDPAQIIELCLKLDQLHLRVVLYVVAFLQVSQGCSDGWLKHSSSLSPCTSSFVLPQ